MTKPTIEESRRLLHRVDYCSPWEYLAAFLFGLRRDNTLRWEVREGSLLEKAGTFCDHRDRAWHDRHRSGGTCPRAIWRRRG